MKSNFKIIIVAIIALVVGLGAGYAIFGKNANNVSASMDAHDHNEEASSSDSGKIWTCSMHPQIKQSEPGDSP